MFPFLPRPSPHRHSSLRPQLNKFSFETLRLYCAIVAGCGLVLYLIPVAFYHPTSCKYTVSLMPGYTYVADWKKKSNPPCTLADATCYCTENDFDNGLTCAYSTGAITNCTTPTLHHNALWYILFYVGLIAIILGAAVFAAAYINKNGSLALLPQ
jgi:hypothetical protein